MAVRWAARGRPDRGRPTRGRVHRRWPLNRRVEEWAGDPHGPMQLRPEITVSRKFAGGAVGHLLGNCGAGKTPYWVGRVGVGPSRSQFRAASRHRRPSTARRSARATLGRILGTVPGSRSPGASPPGMIVRAPEVTVAVMDRTVGSAFQFLEAALALRVRARVHPWDPARLPRGPRFLRPFILTRPLPGRRPATPSWRTKLALVRRGPDAGPRPRRPPRRESLRATPPDRRAPRHSLVAWNGVMRRTAAEPVRAALEPPLLVVALDRLPQALAAME